MSLTDEQFKLRLGKYCASTIEALMKPKGLGAGGETYILKCKTELATGTRQEFAPSKAMQWGIDHEDEARDYFEACTGLSLVKGSTIVVGEIAGTPDFISLTEGYEVKCSESHTHYRRLFYNNWEDVKKEEPVYYWQMVTYMYLLGYKQWNLLSYDPRMIDSKERLIKIAIPRIETDIQLLLTRVETAEKWWNSLKTD